MVLCVHCLYPWSCVCTAYIHGSLYALLISMVLCVLLISMVLCVCVLLIHGPQVGKNKTCLLKDNSEVSLSLKRNLAWVYKEKQRLSDYPDIPKEFLCRYDIGKTLGKGACGEVRICFEKETGTKSAVKVIEMKKFDKDEKAYKSAMLEVCCVAVVVYLFTCCLR